MSLTKKQQQIISIMFDNNEALYLNTRSKAYCYTENLTAPMSVMTLFKLENLNIIESTCQIGSTTEYVLTDHGKQIAKSIKNGNYKQ